MKDLMRRLRQGDSALAVELIARGTFSRADLRELARDLKLRKIKTPEPERRASMEARDRILGDAIGRRLSRAWSRCGLEVARLHARCPGFIPLLAQADHLVAIRAVINCPMSDAEVHQLGKLLDLQHDGATLRQLKVAVEVEIERRKNHAVRGEKSQVTTRRG